MSTSRYAIIKDVLRYTPYSNLINNTDIFSDYVERVYNIIRKRKHYKKKAKLRKKLLDITQTQFKEYMLEIIYMNLYEALILMQQILTNDAMKHEQFLYILNINDNEWVKQRERIRKRLQIKEPTGTRSFIKIGEFSDETGGKMLFYEPQLLKAYKDIIFVPRENTKIFDISKPYQSIAASLFYESDDEFNNEEYMSNKQSIKSYRIWDFTDSTISQIEQMYISVVEGNGDKFAQLLFLEKLFGLVTMSEILKNGYNERKNLYLTSMLAQLSYLGFSRLHQCLITQLNTNNYWLFKEFVDEYIYPVCSDCICICIDGIINYTEHLEHTFCLKKLNKYLSVCKKYINQSPLMSNVSSLYLLSNDNTEKMFLRLICLLYLNMIVLLNI